MVNIPASSQPLPPRLREELATFEKMVHIFCSAHHHTSTSLCDGCANLLHYASRRLKHCTFQEQKPTCGKCPIHCYKPDMRQLAREVMCFAGPRMIFRHPLRALRHCLDGWRKIPDTKNRGAAVEQPSTQKD